MRCSNCGTENSERNLNCSNCGVDLFNEEKKSIFKNKKFLISVSSVFVLIIIGFVIVINSVVIPNHAADKMHKAFESKTGVNVINVFEEYCGNYSVVYDNLTKSGKAVFTEFESCIDNAKEKLNSQPVETDINKYLLETMGDIVLPQEYSAITTIGEYNVELNDIVADYYNLYNSKIAYKKGVELYNKNDFSGAINSFLKVTKEDNWYDDAQNKLTESRKKLLEEKMKKIEKYIADGDYESAQSVINELRNKELTDEISKKLDEYEEKIMFLKRRLSDDCDLILCSGYDGDDYYELVATQEDTYNSVKISIGVIKNNEWLVPLSIDSPFLDNKDGTILSTKAHSSKTYLDDVKDYDFIYIGNGCFYHKYDANGLSYGTIIYNSNNKKSYISKTEDYESFFIELSNEEYINSDKIVIEKNRDKHIGQISDILVLDTESMKTTIIIEKTEMDIIGPYTDDLFAVGRSYRNEISAFYDIEGNEIIDMRKYSPQKSNAYFENGKFTFTKKNAAGTTFEITIDKQGKEINSVIRS